MTFRSGCWDGVEAGGEAEAVGFLGHARHGALGVASGEVVDAEVVVAGVVGHRQSMRTCSLLSVLAKPAANQSPPSPPISALVAPLSTGHSNPKTCRVTLKNPRPNQVLRLCRYMVMPGAMARRA